VIKHILHFLFIVGGTPVLALVSDSLNKIMPILGN